jgi:deoxyribose-phosphate aldolase
VPSLPLLRRAELIILRPDASRADIENICADARARECLAVCVPGARVELAATLLEESPVKVAALIGFPFGNAETDVKRFEIEAALEAGAQELDVVLNHGWIRDGDERRLAREIRDLREAAEERPLKIIIELGLLNADEARRTAQIIVEAEAQFLVTATGCAGRATTEADIRLLREAVGPELGIKAVGGIVDHAQAQAIIDAGANRVGVFDLLPLVAGH